MWAFVAAVLLVAALAGPGVADAADPRFRATVSPDQVVFGETQELTYRVEVVTGSEPERFEVQASAPFAFLGPAGGGEGALLVPTGSSARLEGPGVMRVGPSSHGDIFPCSRSDLRGRHGLLSYFQTFELDLPPESTSTLVFIAPLARDAPWPGERYALDLRAANGFQEEGTLGGPAAIPVAAPAPVGRTGVRLALTTDPPSGGSACADPPRHDKRPIMISGRSDPPLAGQQVELRYVPPGERASVPLASVPVRDDGTFEYANWRPRASGVYELAAVYRAQRPERADDFSVPRVFEVGVPADDPPPLPARVLSRRVAIRRDGRVRLRLTCAVASGSACRGTLRLRREGRIVGRRRVAVPAGTSRTFSVALRLDARARRTLRRRGRLKVSAEAGGDTRRVILASRKAQTVP